MWAFLTGVDVVAPEPPGTIVAFGDSITDGARSTVMRTIAGPMSWRRGCWRARPARSSRVVDMGIGGNRMLNDGADREGAALRRQCAGALR